MDISSIISLKPAYYVTKFEVGKGKHKKTCYNFEDLYRDRDDFVTYHNLFFSSDKKAVKKAFEIIGDKPSIVVVGKNGTGDHYYN